MKHSSTFNPGTYFIGDPCYAIPDSSWSDFCDIMFNNSERTKDWKKFFTFQGHEVGVDSTKYGDGCYNGFCVDSGTIGIVPITLATKNSIEELNRLGRVVEMTKPFAVTFDDGYFYFDNTIFIDTVGDEEEDDYDDYEEDNDF